MKRITILCLITLIVCVGIKAAKVNKSVNIKVNGETRSYWLYVPSNNAAGAPLVIAMHGAGGHSSENSPKFNSIADKEGFIVVYPQGKDIYFPVFGGTIPGWNSTGEQSEDVDFLKAIIEEMVDNYTIDRKRIYCCGFSNGGMMTYSLANTCSDIFAAFASISGFPLNEFHLHHTGRRPVPFLHIHGKQDDFVRYKFMPVITDEMVMRCGANPVPVKKTVSGKYTKNVYEALDGGFPYVYYEIDGMGHADFTNNTEDNSSSQTMWNFFKQYTLDSPCDTTLKWRPRLETEGFAPSSHGWTVNSGKALVGFGKGAKTDDNQNVYHSLQFTSGHYRLCFRSAGETGQTVNVKMQRFKTQKVVIDTTLAVGQDASIPFTIEDDEWGEYRLNFYRANTTDQISITQVGIYTMNDQPVEEVEEGPTMGWSSWNTYGVNISEQLIKKQAAAMVSKGLLKCGYQFVNIDDGYFGGRDTITGQLKIHPTRFPNGLKGVVDYIHGKGLKAGIYSDAGRNTCGSMFNGDVIGKGVGLYEHDQQDADFFFKELGFDFIKVDFCGGSYYHNEDHLVLDERERYSAIAQAIRNTGRTDVRMNACRWAYPGTWISDVAFSWRTTGDINASWGSVRDIIKENLYLSAYCHDGRYNDMDMLEVGRTLTTEEDKTHFGMWCVMSSPLLIGCDLTSIKSTALNLLKNEELIALNQDPLHLQAYVCQRQNDCYVLVKDIEELYGLKRAFAVYNPTDEKQTVTVDFAAMDLGGTILLRNCFKKADAGSVENTLEVTLPAHGTAIYVATAEQRLERKLYEAETAFIGNYQELVNNQALPSGICEEVDYASGGCKAGWLGKSKDNYLEWRNVYSPTGGNYQLTFGFITGESRSMQLTVNGEKVQNFTSLNSGGWQKVGTRSVTVHLNKGVNTVRLSNASSWMPDMDYMKVVLKEADGIENVMMNTVGASSTVLHDLSGKRVNNTSASGIYVVNQKKVLIK